MDSVLTRFIHALRNADVRISTAETLDAFKTAELVGYADRQLLKDALALTLPKTLDEKQVYDACFERFFAARSMLPLAPVEDAGDEPASSTPTAAGEGQGGAGGSQADAPQAAAIDRSDQSDVGRASARREQETQGKPNNAIGASSPLGKLLLRADELEIDVSIHQAGRTVDVHEIEVFTQKGVYTRRIMEAMGAAALQEEIATLSEAATPAQRRLGQELSRRRDWLRERVREYVEQQFLLHADVTGRRLRENLLRDVRISSVEQRHHRQIQHLVLRMAKQLVASYSPRRRVMKRGQLHVPRTLRRNMKYDDTIFELQWKSLKIERPRIFAVCDVSGSVANYARFMLTFLYALEQVLPKVRSFAFSSDLGEVSALFAQHPIDHAIALAQRQYGAGATDYGQALADFCRLCSDDIDRRATVVVLGDARNNYGDTRSDLLKLLYERSRRVIWLNPEPRAMWNTGDSEMRHYAPYCHQVEECGTLAQLERFVSRLVRSA